MKKIILFILTLAVASSAFAIPKTAELVEFRDGVFRKRLLLHLTLRALGIKNCIQFKKNLAEPLRTEATLLTNQVFNENSLLKSEPNTSPEKVIELLTLLKKTGKFNRPESCRDEIALREKGLREAERVKFSDSEKTLKNLCYAGMTLIGFDSIDHCRETMKTLITELDPSCVKNSGAFFKSNNVEINPCFAGTRIIVDSLYATSKSPKDNPEVLKDFLWEMFDFLISYDHEIANAKPGATIELWTLFDHGRNLHSPQSKRFFLAMLTFLATAGTSERGYMGQVYEAIWYGSLRAKVPPAQVYAAHGAINDANDFYMNLFANGLNKKLKITVKGAEITKHNRHNFIAALLSCHFEITNRTEFADTVAITMGFAYEALDFKSHLEKGISWDASVQNFEEDTGRYLESSEWGKNFCH